MKDAKKIIRWFSKSRLSTSCDTLWIEVYHIKKAAWCLPFRPMVQSYPCNLDAFLSRTFFNKILYCYSISIPYQQKIYIMFVLYRGVSDSQDGSFPQHFVPVASAARREASEDPWSNFSEGRDKRQVMTSPVTVVQCPLLIRQCSKKPKTM